MSRRAGAGIDRLEFIDPLLPTLVEKPPEGANWIHEVKFDGYRSQIVIDAGGVRIFTRNGARLDKEIP
jgi:bifunctional non-homologous end joining protein LigD